MRRGFGEAQQFLERMRASQGAERVFVPEPWEIEAERLPAQYADQDFSYVDATSFVTMRHRGLKNAFAFDQHFVVAGFNLLGA